MEAGVVVHGCTGYGAGDAIQSPWMALQVCVVAGSSSEGLLGALNLETAVDRYVQCSSH